MLCIYIWNSCLFLQFIIVLLTALKLILFMSMCLRFKGKDERGRGACVDPAPG